MTDTEALPLARLGNEDAFSTLYANHAASVRSRCNRALRDFADAEDATQDVFLTAFSRLHRFRGDSAFGTWLHTITTCKIRDRLRRRRDMVSLDADENLPEPCTRAPQLLGLQIEEALERLSPSTRAYLDLAAEGYGTRELVELEDRKCASVRRVLREARQRVRQLI